jgi:hypothetical protein
MPFFSVVSVVEPEPATGAVLWQEEKRRVAASRELRDSFRNFMVILV